MKRNKIRRLLIICNVLFILLWVAIFVYLTPTIYNLIVSDAKQELNNNIVFVTDAIRNDSVTHNYGLSVYTIPKDSQRRLKTDMYTFLIIDEDGNLLYSSDNKLGRFVNYRKYEYLDRGFDEVDNSGETIGPRGNRIYYVTTRVIVRNSPYLLVYFVNIDKIYRDVFSLLSIFVVGYLVSAIIIAGLSYYIDKQYKTIHNFREDLLSAYQLLDSNGDTSSYLRRIKKVLHAFSFTTANLIAFDSTGHVLFKNRAFIEAQIKWLGGKTQLADFEDDEPARVFMESWSKHLLQLLSQEEDHIEWFVDTKDVNMNRFYSYNRAKRIMVDGVTFIVCEVQDLTEMIKTKDDVEKYTEYLETILNTVHDVILTTDREGRILDANNALTAMFGYTLFELKNKPIDTIISGNEVVVDNCHILCDGIRHDGTVIRCEIHKNDLLLPHQDIMHLYVIQDVTEREYLREKLYASIALTTETMNTIAGNL